MVKPKPPLSTSQGFSPSLESSPSRAPYRAGWGVVVEPSSPLEQPGSLARGHVLPAPAPGRKAVKSQACGAVSGRGRITFGLGPGSAAGGCGQTTPLPDWGRGLSRPAPPWAPGPQSPERGARSPERAGGRRPRGAGALEPEPGLSWSGGAEALGKWQGGRVAGTLASCTSRLRSELFAPGEAKGGSEKGSRRVEAKSEQQSNIETHNNRPTGARAPTHARTWGTQTHVHSEGTRPVGYPTVSG